MAASALLSTCAPSTARADVPVRPCAPGDPELTSAERELSQIDSAVAALDIAADPEPLVERIKALAATHCLRMMDGLELAPTSGLSLKTYWAEGGSSHVRSYLDLSKPGEHWLWLAPAVRRALTLETNPTSPIRELLCPFADTTCGIEARGWAVRAAHEFRALAVQSNQDGADALATSADPDACKHVALRAARKDRFATFRDCEERRRIEHAALPIGQTRALDHGWLIVQGRRGHYSFCDESRAYDLTTGSAYRMASCSGLELESDGSVDFRATDAQRKTSLEMGHLPLLALREAAWMLLLMGEVDPRAAAGYGVSLPNSVPLTVDDDFWHGFGLTMHVTSADTVLAWRVVGSPETIKAGKLRWSPEPLDDAAAEHAASLLRVAEASLIEDCPEVPPPGSLLRGEPALSASGLDADRESLRVAAQAVTDDWKKLVEGQRACSARFREKRP